MMLLVVVVVAVAVVLLRSMGPSDIDSKDQPKTVSYTADMLRHGPWSANAGAGRDEAGNGAAAAGGEFQAGESEVAARQAGVSEVGDLNPGDAEVSPAGWARLALPMDMLGRPSTKPPLYNWLALPGVAAWQSLPIRERRIVPEWLHKLPSIVAGWAMIALTVTAGIWLVRVGLADKPLALAPPALGDEPELARSNQALPESVRTALQADPLWTGAIAGLVLMSLPPMVSLIYVARPDMLLGAWLVLGWLGVTVCMRQARDRVGSSAARQPDRRPRPSKRSLLWPVLIWVSVAGAVLTKGPAGLLVPIYAVLAAKVLAGRWRAVWDTGMAWGLPAAVLIAGLWLAAAYHANPDYVSQGLLGHQMLGRLDDFDRLGRSMAQTSASADDQSSAIVRYLVGITTTSWKLPFYFFTRAAPWSWVMMVVLVGWALGHGRKVRWPMMPCLLWLAVVFGFFSLSVFKRDDYLLPAYPAMAVIIAWGLAVALNPLRHGRIIGSTTVTGAALLIIAAVLINDWCFNDERQARWGDHVKNFAQAILHEVGRDALDQGRVRFVDAGYHPTQAFLGVNEPDTGDMPQWTGRSDQSPRYIVMPVNEGQGPTPLVVSGSIANIRPWQSGKLGLYRASEADTIAAESGDDR